MNIRPTLEWSILSGALLIAAAIAVSSRWEVSVSNYAIARLDRWTGAVAICVIKYDAYSQATEIGAGVDARCTPATPAEIEAYRRKNHQSDALQTDTSAPQNSGVYDEVLKKLKESEGPVKPREPNTK